MADGARVDPRDTPAEQVALADDARLIRRTRWRLVAWSGLSTLIVLIVLAIVLDETSRRVTLDGKSIDLSPREFSLLECLLRHPGQTLSRDQLLDQAWPFSVAVTPNAVDAYVHYLRDKLGSAGKLIETVRGVGYRLADA